MEECIFCKIIKGEIPSKKLYEDDEILAFYDINPMAKVHFLVIPKKHIESVNLIEEEDIEIIGKIFLIIKKISKELDIEDSGYRVITNTGDDADQTVHHIHFQVLGGNKLNSKLG